MSKKIIFFDVDGTLIDYGRGMKDILDSTKEAIKRIKSQGNLAVLATGRPKSFLTKEILALNFNGYITSNGAYIELEGEEIYNREIDQDTIRSIMDTFNKYEIEFIFEGQKLSYFSSFDSIYMRKLLKGFAIPKKYITSEWKLEEVSTNKFVAVLDTEHKLIKAKEALGEKFAFMNHPGQVSYDLYFKDCTKADGINRLISYLSIPIDNTYAFGDGINDIEMLQTVKYGIAMGNANERLKKVADLVTNDVVSHGIYNALKKLEVI